MAEIESHASPRLSRNPNLEGCQIPCLPLLSVGVVQSESQPFILRLKRTLARPWNYFFKANIKKFRKWIARVKAKAAPGQASLNIHPASTQQVVSVKPGDLVRVRSVEEIQATLDEFKELKGCAFLPNMKEFCNTTQRVLQPMDRFLDERDYKVKRTKGIVLLENVLCHGTPVFGRCDRACHLFWRIEWLEKIE